MTEVLKQAISTARFRRDQGKTSDTSLFVAMLDLLERQHNILCGLWNGEAARRSASVVAIIEEGHEAGLGEGT